MHFASPVVRPPYEAGSAYLQVTRGCSHDGCLFCTYYKNTPFSVSPEREVAEDLDELARSGIPVSRIWLQGADPFLLSYDRLMRIADLIRQKLPQVGSIGGYGRVDSLRNKSPEQLSKLRGAGYSGIVFGVESGDDEVLALMNKGYRSEEIARQLEKMDEAGLDYAVIYLCGLAGKGNGLRNARRTAAVFNRIRPSRILISSLTIFEDTPLRKKILEGGFKEEGEVERIREIQELLRLLENPALIDARNASAMIPLYGAIPGQKEEMLTALDSVASLLGENALRRMRSSLAAI